MPIVELDRSWPVFRGVLLTAGLGVVFGLLFGLPPAWGVCAIGWPWVPCGLGILLCGLLAGLSLAYLVVAFVFNMPLPRVPGPAVPPVPVFPLRRGNGSPKSGSGPCSAIRQRLANENVTLVKLQADRERLHDSRYGNATEERIVWSELLELEIQDIDEQVNRIRRASGD